MPPRLLLPERMDDPALPKDEHTLALQGLARLNALSGRAKLLWRPLKQLAIDLHRPLRVLDVATGSGDHLLDLSQRAVKAKLPVTFLGVDISPVAIATAQQASSANPFIEFAVADVFQRELPTGYDVVLCSLFLHHLTDTQAVELLRKLAAATRHLLLINDLARSTFNRLLVTATCHLVTRSPVVHYDGPQSVRAAFTPKEALALAKDAGLTNVGIQSKFPCRWLLEWRKPR